MSAPETTPGPWSVALGDGETVLPDVYASGVSIFDIYGKEAQANAHLIAAAPDLYAALEAILHVCGENYYEGFVENSLSVDEIDVARAALAKARGETR